MNSNNQTELSLNPQQGGRVSVTYYTDPLCCWSWAFEPHWQRFVQEYGDQCNVTICTVGMIADWKTYNDPFNSINRPVQMGALWMHVAEATGAQLDESIWVNDPPASSYPACLAVKCAGLQSEAGQRNYLYKIRKAVMAEGVNVAKMETLLQLASELSGDEPDLFSYEQFSRDFSDPRHYQLLRDDIEKARYYKVGRFPTLTISRGGKGVMLTGYRPFEAVRDAFERVVSLPTEMAANTE